MGSHHEPALFRSRRYGCWATCECGRWHSKRWTTTIGAHIEFGRHLLEQNGGDACATAAP